MSEFVQVVLVLVGIPAINIVPAVVAGYTITRDCKWELSNKITTYFLCIGWLIALGYYMASHMPVGNTSNPNNYRYSYWWPELLIMVALVTTICGCFTWSKQAGQEAEAATKARDLQTKIAREQEGYRLAQAQAQEHIAQAHQNEQERVARQLQEKQQALAQTLPLLESQIQQYVKRFVPASDPLFGMWATDLVPTEVELVELITSLFGQYPAAFADATVAYNTNVNKISEEVLTRTDYERGKRVGPREYKGHDVLERYLGNVPYIDFLWDMHVPIGIPAGLRPQHGVIVGESGAGKTQLLEKLILADLDSADRPAIIVIDSKDDLIPRVASLARFNTDLADKIIIIDHRDKPALNMFDVGEVTNEKVNVIEASMRYFFGSLLEDDLSGQMNTLFTPLLHLVLRVPGATLADLRDLCRNPLLYPELLEQLPKGIRSFVEQEMVGGQRDDPYRATKQALITRVQRIINQVTLDEMFSGPANTVDIADAIEQRKIVLISTDASGLRDLSPIFGRFWISQVFSAGLSRGSGYGRKRPNVHFYIDECAPYVDDKLISMLTTIRSYGIGLMMAFQGTWQMKTYAGAILQNTAIKFASGDVGVDLPDINPVQSTETTGAFSLYYRDLPRTMNVSFPFGELDLRPQMSTSQYQSLRTRNKKALQATSKAPPRPRQSPKPNPPVTEKEPRPSRPSQTQRDPARPPRRRKPPSTWDKQ